MIEQVLENLGMSQKEITVYIALLRTGPAMISIVSKRAGISRSTTYNVLMGLADKGYVRKFSRAGVLHFAALSPSELIDLLYKSKEDIDNKIDLVNRYRSQFESLSNPQITVPKVSYYEGIEGIKNIYEDILKKGNKDTFAAFSLDNMVPEIKDWLFRRFTTRKVKKNISSRVIVSSKNPRKFLKLDKKHLRKSLIISCEKYPFEVEIDVYDKDKTAFISYDETEMMGVIIESEKIANTMKSLFEFAWDKLKK